MMNKRQQFKKKNEEKNTYKNNKQLNKIAAFTI